MQRVDKHDRASERESGRDATVAEAGHDVGFRRAGQAGLSQPRGQIGEEGFVHIATLQPQRAIMAHCVDPTPLASKWQVEFLRHGVPRFLGGPLPPSPAGAAGRRDHPIIVWIAAGGPAGASTGSEQAMSRRLGSCLAEDLRPCVGLLTVALAVAGHFAPSARADSVAAFYQGKDIKLLISGTVGGGYDIYARTLAKHLGAHIPGLPTVIPQNMPAAGGLAAANYTYNVAPRDGTVICLLQNTVPLEPFYANNLAHFGPPNLSWLGPPTTEVAAAIRGA